MRRTVILWFVCLFWLATSQAQDDTVIGPDNYPPNVNPLTGLEVTNPAILNQRPLMIKVPNAPAAARPQWSLQQADIIWEYVIAGGFTRIVPIYLTNSPERVGPIRSLRLVDFDLTRLYRGLVATSGMSDGTWETLFRDPVMESRVLVGESYDAFYRDPNVGRSYDLTLFSNTDQLRELADGLNKDVVGEQLYGMAFSDAVVNPSKPLSELWLDYASTKVRWLWDDEQNVWLREQDGVLHTTIEGNDELPLKVDNVVIIEEDHNVANRVRDAYWGYSNFAYSAPFIGSGRVYVLRDGQYIEGEWRRENRNDMLTFFDTSGNPLAFKPGLTFFNLVPRWSEGYSLTLLNPQAMTGTITASSVNLRWGPSTNFSAGGAAYNGDQLPVIGRNNSGSWVQIYDEANERALWLSANFINLERDISELPIVRPSVEN